MPTIVAISAEADSRSNPVGLALSDSGFVHGRIPTRNGGSLYWVKAPAALAETLRALPTVERVHAFEQPYGLVARDPATPPTQVDFGPAAFGGAGVLVVAGPCSVESHQQIERLAGAVAGAGAHGLRGGAFKPRTSPYSFQGLGRTGLQLMAAAAAGVGLPIVTEVMTPEEVELVAEYADMLQIGSRNMQNFRLLEAVGAARRPVLLKRGMMARLDEFLAAAEYVYARGNTAIVLCERGIRSFDPHLRNTLDLGSVAVLKRLTHLPVIVDPSHGTGRADVVADLALAALAAGADGLMIEVHDCPEQALSDGFQALTPDELSRLIERAGLICTAVGRSLAHAR